jgi:hypothetical protein
MKDLSLENFRPFGDGRRKMRDSHWKPFVLSGMREGKWGTSSLGGRIGFRVKMAEKWSLFIGKPSASSETGGRKMKNTLQWTIIGIFGFWR